MARITHYSNGQSGTPAGLTAYTYYTRMARPALSADGHELFTAIVCVGETLLFRAPSYPHHKAESAWDYGIWLGKCTRSDEHVVGTATQIYRAMPTRILPDTYRYNNQRTAQRYRGNPAGD